MSLLAVTVVLFIIAFLGAFYSVGKEGRKPREIEKTKEELQRERVIFHA